MTTISHKTTSKDLTAQVAAFIADPSGWPAAMASRAVRLAAGHPAYSISNQTLIVSQLWTRFTEQGLSNDAGLQSAVRAAGVEIAPRSVWTKRGYTPKPGSGLAVWSRPVPIWVDPVTGQKVKKDTHGALERSVFRVEWTYCAGDVVGADGEPGEAAFVAPELPDGKAREVFELLSTWITSQGWTVQRSGRDMDADGYTDHISQKLVVHGGLTEWSAVGVLAHEIAHALLHGAGEDRRHAGEHRGDMEAEAEAVAFGLLSAFGQGELARASVSYVAIWARDPARVAVAYERSCHLVDALANVALGVDDVTVARSAKADKAQLKADNKALAASLRDAGLEPKGEVWRRAKAGESVASIAADLACGELVAG